jgi:hypothetical protein
MQSHKLYDQLLIFSYITVSVWLKVGITSMVFNLPAQEKSWLKIGVNKLWELMWYYK